MGAYDPLDDAKKHMREQGWCVVPDVLSKEQTEKVLKDLWDMVESAGKRGEDTFLPFLDPNESNVRVFYLLEQAVFRELIQHPTALQMVKSVLGDNYLISNVGMSPSVNCLTDDGPVYRQHCQAW